MKPPKEIIKVIDDNTFRFLCVDEGAGYLDTKVILNGQFFCRISWARGTFRKRTTICPYCGREFKSLGLASHRKACSRKTKEERK